MGQNSENSKRVMRKTKNERNELIYSNSQPLDTFPPKNKSFSTKLFNGKILIEREWVS